MEGLRLINKIPKTSHLIVESVKVSGFTTLSKQWNTDLLAKNTKRYH